MPEALSTKHIARRLAARQAGSEAYYARQVRNFTQGRLLEPVGKRGVGRTAAAEYAEHHIFEAQILSVLTEIGLTPSLLDSAIRVLRGSSLRAHLPEDLPHSLKPGHSQGVIKDSIAGVTAGEQWDFQLRILRKPDGSQYVTGSVVFAFRELENQPFVAMVKGDILLGTILLSLNSLFAPLLGD